MQLSSNSYTFKAPNMTPNLGIGEQYWGPPSVWLSNLYVLHTMQHVTWTAHWKKF